MGQSDMADGSRRFTLKGGPSAGTKVRLYPDNPREHRKGMKPVWGDHTVTTACGTTATYQHPNPEDQLKTRPYLTFLEETI